MSDAGQNIEQGSRAQGEQAGSQQVVYVERQANGMAVASLVLGIVGAVFGLIPLTFFIALICGVLALIFGAIAWKKANAGAGRKGMAIAGFILGLVAVGLAFVGIFIIDQAVTDLEENLNNL